MRILLLVGGKLLLYSMRSVGYERKADISQVAFIKVILALISWVTCFNCTRPDVCSPLG